MKFYSLILLSLAISLGSCRKENLKPESETGMISVGIDYAIDIHEVNSRLKSAPATDSFKVVIYQSDGTEVASYENAIEMPDTIGLSPGNYYVEAFFGTNAPAAFENPWYYGVSEVFAVNSGSFQSVSINCILSNTIVSVSYSESVINQFSQYSTTVSSGIDSLVFGMTETRNGYFQPDPLDIRASLSYLNADGTLSTKLLQGSIPDPSANKHYEIQINASVGNGAAGFIISLDDSSTVSEIIELNDSEVDSSGIGYGDLLITEIMANPANMADNYGEWFEVYNNSGKEINLQNLMIDRDSINQHFISDEINLSAGEYFVFQKTDSATAASNSYVYGSDILLPNSGTKLSIYTTDENGDRGSLVFSLQTGSAVSGKSTSLNPMLFNVSDAVETSSWCTSSSSYSTGDYGTPGATNDNCK